MSETSIIPAPPSKIRIAGRDVSVGVLTMGQLLQTKNIFSGGKLERLSANTDLLGAIEVLPDEFIDLCLVATDLTRDEINAVQIDEFVLLCAEIVEKNHDFFVRRLGPSLKKLLGQLVKVAALAGGFKHSSS